MLPVRRVVFNENKRAVFGLGIHFPWLIYHSPRAKSSEKWYRDTGIFQRSHQRFAAHSGWGCVTEARPANSHQKEIYQY